MLTPILARIPGSLFFKALMDGEPMAFVMLAGVITLFGIGYSIKYLMKHAK